jgi:hypothetical protein
VNKIKCDDGILLERAKRAYMKGSDYMPMPSNSSFVREDSKGRLLVELVNVRDPLATYRFFPRQNRLRRID